MPTHFSAGVQVQGDSLVLMDHCEKYVFFLHFFGIVNMLL